MRRVHAGVLPLVFVAGMIAHLLLARAAVLPGVNAAPPGTPATIVVYSPGEPVTHRTLLEVRAVRPSAGEHWADVAGPADAVGTEAGWQIVLEYPDRTTSYLAVPSRSRP